MENRLDVIIIFLLLSREIEKKKVKKNSKGQREPLNAGERAYTIDE